jgi:hypothetical protein
MPGYKGHIVGGAITGAVVVLMISSADMSYTRALELVFCAILGSLFPDIDTKSKGQLFFYRCYFALFIYLAWCKRYDMATMLGIVLFLPILSRHRGIFHRAWFLFLMSLLLMGYVGYVFPTHALWLYLDISLFLCGALSHIWLDSGIKGIMRLR